MPLERGDGSHLSMPTQCIFRANDLPLELQREIFCVAAQEDSSNVHQLALVARRVCSWVEPYIYQMVTLGSADTKRFLRTVNLKPRHFFANTVKRLCLAVSVSAPDAARILTVCSGVRELAFWVDFIGASPSDLSPLHRYIAPLSLRRLSMEFTHLASLLSTSPNPCEEPWSMDLTHLDVVFWSHEESPAIPGVEALPALTHLALWLQHSSVSVASLDVILSSCRLLRILVVVVDELEIDPSDQETFADPRIVLLPYPDVVPDWEAPVKGRPDTWSKAEDVVERQMKKAKAKASRGHAA